MQTPQEVARQVQGLNVAQFGVNAFQGGELIVGQVQVHKVIQVLQIIHNQHSIVTQIQELNLWNKFHRLVDLGDAVMTQVQSSQRLPCGDDGSHRALQGCPCWLPLIKF